MKKVFKLVKGRRDERRECGGITPSQSGDLISPARTPEDERFLGLDNNYGYIVDFSGKDKSLTKLHKAAWQGNLDKLKSALKKVEVDAVDRHNRTALHFAIARGHPNIVWFLLGNNAKTSVCDDEGHTPLLKAIECGHKECMTLLLDRGANVNVADYTGNTGLHIAVARGSLDTTSALLKTGADTEISNNAGDYPLHIATRLENKDLVDLLLSAGASLDVLDRENRTPLMLAAKTGNSLLAELFVEQGAQLTVVDSNGWTAQDYAMLGGHENIASALSRHREKKPIKSEGSNDSSGSWPDNRTEKEPVSEKLREIFAECSEAEKEDLSESPDAEAIPPYCQPPKSWEMIQAGMIDEKKDGSEPKRRSITTLGTLHSRRESFTEAPAVSPKFTLSLNRRKVGKGQNAFAKHRFSFNEEESLSYWMTEEKKLRQDLGEMLNLEEKRLSTSDSDWDSVSGESSKKLPLPGSESSEGGTLGRNGTMLGVEEVWVANPRVEGERQTSSWDSEGGSPEKEKSFPPPPTALELGVDMAKSIKYMKGVSVDEPPGRTSERNLWISAYESHSLDCLEERDFVETSKVVGPPSPEIQRGEEARKCPGPTDRFKDVSRRINEQLECYDQALRELAESSRKAFPAQNYFSLPSKTVNRGEWMRMNAEESFRKEDDGPRSLPSSAPQGKPPENSQEGKSDKKSKRHMLLTMRDIKYAVNVTNSFKTSMDDQILSPLAKPEDSFDSDEKTSPKENQSSGSGGNSPADENPFFGMGRQETVLERNDMGRESSGSGTGEESTLWLQDEPQKENSDEDVSEIAADEGSKHNRACSFSPLGVIHREMEEESRRSSRVGPAGRPFRRENWPTAAEEALCGEHEDQNEEVPGEQSPDISLSSGPIEPLGADKDSGSEPESSHNDISPSHNYALKTQHEWLKCHLKAATSEKNKLEELAAQLTEKAERLQYELADAKEAAKSRDEVIQLLQAQLARMEAAYTKSLEESVQSRLQLTSHEQEILHLKELCYKYQEEKEAAVGGAEGGDFLQELQLRIKILEEEKGKMREEITHLEEEKSVLEKRLRNGQRGESEILDQCQRWKERCGQLEEMVKAYDSKQSAYESFLREKDTEHYHQQNQLKQQNLDLEKKFLELNGKNIELKAKVQTLAAAVERDRGKAPAGKEEEHELKKRNLEIETRLRNLEKEMEEKLVTRLKEKEAEVGELVAQFNRERDALVASYEKKLLERRSREGAWVAEECRRENERLRQVIEGLREQVARMQMSESGPSRLQDEWNSMSKSIAEVQNGSQQLSILMLENLKLSKEVNEYKAKVPQDLAGENARVQSDILELKNQVECFKTLLSQRGGGSPRQQERRPSQKLEGRKSGAGMEDGLAWSSLYGMKANRKRGCGRTVEECMSNSDTKPVSEHSAEAELRDFELLELKKQILSLQSKMSDEKNLRHALENEMVQIRLNLSGKENLEMEVDSLKRKLERDWLRKSEMELLEHERNLTSKREKYLERGEEAVVRTTGEDYKAKCEALAKEREKSKELGKGGKIVCLPPETLSQVSNYPCLRAQPAQVLLQPRPVALDPDIKNKLEYELDRSIRKYMQESSSIAPVSNVQT